jgi:NhaP-type Na+/H+ or K+/H+ antiporter
VALFSLAVVLYVSQSGRLDRAGVSAPLVFSILGTCAGLTVFPGHLDTAMVRELTETTLALVLFSDASRIRVVQLRLDAALGLRLLLIGFPLTLLLGLLVAHLMSPAASIFIALLVAAALAPTDAGLGAATVLNPVVPARIRRVLNLESGLNDGLATPVVLFAITAAGQTGPSHGSAVLSALRELGVGVLLGVVLGGAVALIMRRASDKGTGRPELVPVALIATPLLAYFSALALDGNGFVAAFVAGVGFASVRPARRRAQPELKVRAEDPDLVLTEGLTSLLTCAVWALFGVVAIAHLGALFTWQGLVFAVLALTVLRMLPVALALLRSGLRTTTVAFIGWFGPRGLASIVFGLIALESLPDSPELRHALGAITLTVVLSVVLHGASAGPWAAAYGRWVSSTRPATELVDSDT